MEVDCYQLYFVDYFDTEEDFYKSTAPSEDIWKKFELLQTPPLSPSRTLSGTALHLPPGDKLSWLSKVLGQDDDSESHFIPDTKELLGNLSSIIVQDCMWSSFSATKHPEKVKAAGLQGSNRPGRAHCAPPAGPRPGPVPDCVDPAAVLTLTANGCRKAALSGSDSSEDDDDEDDDDDEEEIDVVSVENKQNQSHLVNSRKPVTVTVRADPCPKRFHVSVHQQQHNYAARSPDTDPEPDHEDSDQEPDVKRACTSFLPGRSSLPSSPSESLQNSDAEDTDRRRNHNILERKRREDLRSRFLALRDQIPGLESVKTPKVVILTQAAEYIAELHVQEKRHIKEKRRLKSRQQMLVRRVSELKRS
ncbi:protein L-Myc-1b-like [Thalassophryne amazonica]|uniref:protein L-Myc-1b-like n=1 Tax=Thalassophryne amazonica TaxID=390379 RepID=UPI0014713ABF|nr:protein L-Myc-1b-like [Thalassophryne amazonica]